MIFQLEMHFRRPIRHYTDIIPTQTHIAYFSKNRKAECFLSKKSKNLEFRRGHGQFVTKSNNGKTELMFLSLSLCSLISDLSGRGLRWRQLSRWSTAPCSLGYVGQIAWAVGNDAVIVEKIGNQFLPSLNIIPFLSRGGTQTYMCWLRQCWQR